jgi:hypothetical protein
VDRASVEWDFYYEQLQMYQEYVMKKVLPGVTDLPGSTFDPSVGLSGVLTERTNLRDAYNRASLALQTRLTQENIAFYERLDVREDRRRNYLEWLEERKDELVAWAEMWQANVEAENFRAGNPVNRDSWYAKTNFGNPNPMAKVINGQMTLITKNAVETDNQTLNVVSRNLTPYDLLDSYGRPRVPNPRTSRRTEGNTGLVLLDTPDMAK